MEISTIKYYFILPDTQHTSQYARKSMSIDQLKNVFISLILTLSLSAATTTIASTHNFKFRRVPFY
jgi:hypothetical protein